MGPFSGNGKEGRRGTHRVHQTYHGEASASDNIRDMGDAQGGRIAVYGKNAVGNDLYREKAGKRVTVGGVTTDV